MKKRTFILWYFGMVVSAVIIAGSHGLLHPEETTAYPYLAACVLTLLFTLVRVVIDFRNGGKTTAGDLLIDALVYAVMGACFSATATVLTVIKIDHTILTVYTDIVGFVGLVTSFVQYLKIWKRIQAYETRTDQNA